MLYRQNRFGFTITIDDIVIAENLSREESLAVLYKHKGDVDYEFYMGNLPHSDAVRINREIFNTQKELMRDVTNDKY